MKQTVFKQLLLLAVFLFAGIGSAFGQKKITVSRNAQLTYVSLYMTSSEEYGVPTSSDDEKVVFEVEQGSDCRLEVYPTNQLAYRVSKVTVGSEDVTADMNANGYVIIPSVEDDIELQAVVSEIGETKTISFSTVYDTGDEVSYWLYFYDPARDYRVEFNQESVELLVNSTTQMTIETERGWKVKTLKVDGTNVTETYYSQGYYEFENLQADHSVAVELGEAKTYTITVNRDEIPADIEVDANFTDRWAAEYGVEYEFNEGTFVTLDVEAIVQDEDGKQFQVRIYDGDTDVTPNSIDGGYYAYTINNLSSDHQIFLKHEETPTITVHCTYNNENYYGFLDFTLNDEGFGLDQPIAFAKGSNVTFALKDIPYHMVLESIKIDDNDITSSFGGSYVLSDLTADHVITLSLSDAGETYGLAAHFDPLSTGTIYLKSKYVEKDETTNMPFAAGTVATLIVKAPIGHKVSKIHLTFIDGTEKDVSDISFNPDTKEYYCEIKMTADTEAFITTQEKPDDGTTGIAYSQASGMATFCSEYDLDFSSEATKDIAAYVAIGFNSEASKLMLLRVTEAKRGTPLIIIGKPGSYTIPVKATSRNYQNLLKAVDVETKLTSGGCGEICYTNYVLSGNAFFSTDFTVPAYQAYLQLPDPITGGSGPVSLEFIDMGDMNGDAKITITDAVMIVDKILNEQ